MIEIIDLVKTYNVKGENVEALKGINLNIDEGEIFGIIGLSGAGKSSLVRCINLLEKPTSGSILVDNENLSNLNNIELRKARKKIGMVFQHFNLLNSKTVYDNIAFPMKLNGYSKKEIEEKVNYLLDLVGLSDKKKAYPRQLSGGQKQRVGIARALSNDPKVIMCDEATSALDPTTTSSILELLKEVNRKLKITIIIVTHEMDVIKNICNKVAILENGLVIENDSVKNILVQPKTSIARDFFGKIDMYSQNMAYQNAINGDGVIVNAIFIGEKSTDPYISNMIKKFDVSVSILLGDIQEKDEELIGNLVIKISGEDSEIKKSIEYLENNQVIVEVANG